MIKKIWYKIVQNAFCNKLWDPMVINNKLNGIIINAVIKRGKLWALKFNFKKEKVHNLEMNLNFNSTITLRTKPFNIFICGYKL